MYIKRPGVDRCAIIKTVSIGERRHVNWQHYIKVLKVRRFQATGREILQWLVVFHCSEFYSGCSADIYIFIIVLIDKKYECVYGKLLSFMY